MCRLCRFLNRGLTSRNRQGWQSSALIIDPQLVMDVAHASPWRSDLRSGWVVMAPPAKALRSQLAALRLPIMTLEWC